MAPTVSSSLILNTLSFSSSSSGLPNAAAEDRQDSDSKTTNTGVAAYCIL